MLRSLQEVHDRVNPRLWADLLEEMAGRLLSGDAWAGRDATGDVYDSPVMSREAP